MDLNKQTYKLPYFLVFYADRKKLFVFTFHILKNRSP